MALREVGGEAGFDLADVLAPSSAIGARRKLSRSRRVAIGVVFPMVVVAAWATLSATGTLPERRLPPPAAVARSARDFVVAPARPPVPGVVRFKGAAGDHVRASVGRWVQGYAIALVVGLPLGLSLGLSKWVSPALDPLFQAYRAVPITAWLPIALVWFGFGEGAARFLVFVGALSPIVVATADSAFRVPRQLVDTARMLGTRPRDLARRVYLPAAFPGIVTGLRLGLVLGWTTVIVAELTGTTRGLGAMMFSAREVSALDQIIVGMAAFAIIGLIGDILLRAVTRPLVRWADA
ncbi:MAG TPA: ABC transporter permease [Acidimicrobiales bacterium]|nr:ABC transporter permease [Acidimicrobiales bacterium]